MHEPPPTPTPAELLAEARQAWKKKVHAEAEIARLGRYKGRSRAMARDELDHYGRLNEATATLTRILGRASQ